MRHVLAPTFLCALRLLLPLATCGWGPAIAAKVWSNPDELVHLFTSDSSVNLHLRIKANGQVDGSKQQNVNTAVVIKNITLGHIKFIGAKTGLNLCMRSNGELFGSASFNDNDCVFKLHVLENFSYTFESVKHNFLLSLGNVKGPLVGNWNLPSLSQFLIKKNEVPIKKF